MLVPTERPVKGAESGNTFKRCRFRSCHGKNRTAGKDAGDAEHTSPAILDQARERGLLLGRMATMHQTIWMAASEPADTFCSTEYEGYQTLNEPEERYETGGFKGSLCQSRPSSSQVQNPHVPNRRRTTLAYQKAQPNGSDWNQHAILCDKLVANLLFQGFRQNKENPVMLSSRRKHVPVASNYLSQQARQIVRPVCRDQCHSGRGSSIVPGAS